MMEDLLTSFTFANIGNLKQITQGEFVADYQLRHKQWKAINYSTGKNQTEI